MSGSVADSGHAAVYLRQLLRGNRAKRVLRSLPARQPPRSGDSATATPGQPPVLLIHGYLATRGSLHLLEQPPDRCAASSS